MDTHNDSTDRAVSPAVGVVLMVAISTLLAATTASFLLGLGDSHPDAAPQMATEFQYSETGGGDELEIGHSGGETVPVERLTVVIDDADAGGSGDPNRRYNVSELGVSDTTVRAGDVIVVSQSTVDGATAGTVSNLDLRSATVTLVWHAPGSSTAMTVTTWSGPDA